jgi:hypothetical protein
MCASIPAKHDRPTAQVVINQLGLGAAIRSGLRVDSMDIARLPVVFKKKAELMVGSIYFKKLLAPHM